MKESRLQQFFFRYLSFAEKNPFVIIIVGLVLACLCWFPISKIRLDADLDDLLPQNTPTINAMKESNERYGSADLFTIAIQHPDPEVIAKVQDETKEGNEKWDNAVYVQVEGSNEFFMKHALMCLPIPHWERIVHNLVDIKLERRTQTPLVADLDDNPEEQSKKKQVRVFLKDIEGIEKHVARTIEFVRLGKG